jgi:hypothetical protein
MCLLLDKETGDEPIYTNIVLGPRIARAESALLLP